MFVAVVALAFATPAPASAGRGPQWESLAPAPTPRTEAAAVALAEEIYLMGGFVLGGASVPLVEIYDTVTDTWRPGPPLPIPVNHAYAAAVDGTVYIFGGYLGPAFGGALQPLALPTDRAFALQDGIWESIAPLPAPRGAGSAAVVGDKVYLVGGVDGDSLAHETLVYDTRRDRWAEIDGLPPARQHLGVTSFRDHIYALGGRVDLLNSNMPYAHLLDARRAAWRELPMMPVASGGLGAAATSNGYVIGAGGEHQTGVFGDVNAFDVFRRKWRGLPDMPTPRHGLGVVAIGTKLFTLAGGTEPGYSYSTANEAIDLAAFR